MRRCYVTADVFTSTPFEGNPVAVVLDAQGLSTQQMQSIAAEFSYSETTFVLPPRDPKNTAHVRIFTPSREIPFAGHPNIGTAFVLATRAVAAGKVLPNTFLFEEIAGTIPVTLIREGGSVTGGTLVAPEPLSRRSEVPPAQVAECLSLGANDICTDAHRPQVVSVGLPFLVVELASRDALHRCVPNPVTFKETLPLDGAVSIYAYTRDVVEQECDLQARMFTPRMTEDPATGSATAATAALLLSLRDVQRLELRVQQGVDMGRPSLLLANADESVVTVGGHCVEAFSGTFTMNGSNTE